MKKRRSLAANIITVFLIFNILSVLFFTYYIQKKGQTEAIQYARKSTLEVINEKSEVISLAFEHIRSQTESLGM